MESTSTSQWQDRSSRTSLEIVINIEEQWHIDLLSNVPPDLKNLTLAIRTNSKENQNSNYDPTLMNSYCSLGPLSRAIENMSHLTKLRIYSEVCGTFCIKSYSLEHLLFQGSLVLEQFSCPRLKTLDISFAIDSTKDDDHILFRQMSPSVEELTLRIDSSGENYHRVDDYEVELQQILLPRLRLKKLQLVPSERCSFFLKDLPPSPKSVCDRK